MGIAENCNGSVRTQSGRERSHKGAGTGNPRFQMFRREFDQLSSSKPVFQHMQYISTVFLLSNDRLCFTF